MKYQLKEFNRNIPDQDLLDDLKKVATKFTNGKMTKDDYNENGQFHAGTLEKRFGTWNKALEKAGVEIITHRNISEKDLFENLENVWIKLGRQPIGRQDLKKPLSKYTVGAYANKFGTWSKALKTFVEFMNLENNLNQESEKVEESISEIIQDNEIIFKHKTKRFPSERLKVQVLMRDGNKCALCGITVTGDNIHFDHIQPWSKGGETVLENLQVLCETHNLAKGNFFPSNVS
jgi:hypothetical protein